MWCCASPPYRAAQYSSLRIEGVDGLLSPAFQIGNLLTRFVSQISSNTSDLLFGILEVYDTDD